MKVCVLGTGSSGNSTLVEAGETRVLVDAGFSGRDLVRRLAHAGLPPEGIHGIVITHDHSDHTRGAGVFSRRNGTPIYVTQPTLTACPKIFLGTEKVVVYQATSPFRIGQIRVEPFLTIHDAVDPVAVALVDEETDTRIGIATDLGRPTAQVRLALKDSDFLILEANHDQVLLRNSSYPWSVQQRISSSHGHLSNHDAAHLACDLLHPRLAGIVLAHLSQECNRPGLAAQVVGDALRAQGFEGFLDVALQDKPTEVFDIEELRRRSGPAQLSLL